MQPLSYYQEIISNHFNALIVNEEPANLYEPIKYILSLGGKRMRPVLTLMATKFLMLIAKKSLVPATAVEVFIIFH
jgi:geranylgeranyl diphosphate synthase type II